MPQLVKGGKYVFGWSRVGYDGRIGIPLEALDEYGLKESEKLIVRPGSRTSGGFSLGSLRSLEGTVLGLVLETRPELGRFTAPEGEVVEHRGKPHCWVTLRDGGVTIPPSSLERFGVRTGDRLLVVRGSGLAVSLLVKGRIVEEAEKHPELKVVEPGT